ncbi:MAG TPA: MFS transporter [Candidatus Acidoferrum sp.]|nr:MFS transporter [Candidatus Acidoferrum sp.]
MATDPLTDRLVRERAVRERSRWLVLAVIGIGFAAVVTALTAINVALPSAQHEMQFTTADRQWVVTAYTLAFGSLLLAGGRLVDLFGQKTTFLVGLLGFAAVSAVGGASVNFGMLVAGRAFQGAFAALLVPAAISLLSTTFTDPKERARAFGIFGAIATAGGAVGLLIGGALTEYLSWRWTLYANVIFAGVAFVGGTLVLTGQPSPTKPRLDIPGVLLSSAGMFSLVYGFGSAATNSWGNLATWGFLVAGAALLALFALWMGRAANPLLPPRIVLNRNRAGAYVATLFAAFCMFATFFLLTYYLQGTLNFSPLTTGLAFLPISASLVLASNLSTIVLLPRVGPRPLVPAGLALAVGGTAWLAQLGPHTGYAQGVLGPLVLIGLGLGSVIAPSLNAGTFGVARQDAGEAAATVTVGQQLGASISTSLLNTIFATAVASYLVTHAFAGHATNALALADGYDTAFWWTAVIAAGGAVFAALLFRSGPLSQPTSSLRR